ncbi:MAG: hypothetical protein WDM81_13935 [Rhizomicrobium sp.]
MARAPASGTAPNGGTAANAFDGDLSTVVLTTSSGIGTTANFVVVTATFTDQQAVDFVDVEDIKLTLAGAVSANEFRVQYSADNATFHDFGDPFTVTDSERTRAASRRPARSRRNIGA